MTVTEIAILTASSGTVSQELKDIFVAAQKTQDEWFATTFPNSGFQPGTTRGAMYQQVENPAKILILAQWDSVAQHLQWIGGDANKEVLGSLTSHLVLEGEGSVSLLHANMDIFDPSVPAGSTHLLDSPIVRLGVFSIASDKRDVFQKDLGERIQILEDFAKPHMVHGGWREDKVSEAQDEYAMLAGWESADRHKEFVQSSGFPRYAEIRQHTSSAEINDYKRFA